MRRDLTEHATYHTDLVTVRILARMPDRIDDVCASLRHDTPFMATIGTGPVQGDPRIATVAFIAWARRRLLSRITFATGDQFVEGGLACARPLPDTVRAAAAGRPCAAVIDHPVLAGLVWTDEHGDDPRELDTGHDTDIDLGPAPGARLRELALAEAARLEAVTRAEKRAGGFTG